MKKGSPEVSANDLQVLSTQRFIHVPQCWDDGRNCRKARIRRHWVLQCRGSSLKGPFNKSETSKFRLGSESKVLRMYWALWSKPEPSAACLQCAATSKPEAAEAPAVTSEMPPSLKKSTRKASLGHRAVGGGPKAEAQGGDCGPDFLRGTENILRVWLAACKACSTLGIGV